MIERQIINDRPATVAYLNGDFTPAGKGAYALAKILFDDGDVIFVATGEGGANADAGEEAAGFNRHRAKPYVHPTAETEGEDEAAAWAKHRGRQAATLVIVVTEPEIAVEHQLEAWSKAIMILDASEMMVRDLIETRLAGMASILHIRAVGAAQRVVSVLMRDITAVRTEAVKTAFRAVRTQLGDRAILDASLSRWAAAFLRDDLRNIGQAIQAGIVEGLDHMEIARKIVGTLANNGVDGVTQYTRTKIAHLGRAAIKESNLRKREVDNADQLWLTRGESASPV